MDTTLPFEQIFLRTLEDGGPEQFVGYLDDERQKALALPEEVFKSLYDDWVSPKQFYQETV